MAIPLVIAHRGVSVEFPENTVAAFAAATSRGADGVELDVRSSRDGHLVVHHDAHLGDGRPVVSLDRSELPSEIPTLAEALDACGEIRVNIEIKNFPGEPDFDESYRVAAQTVELVRARGMADRVIVSSFNYEDIQAVRRIGSDVATGWLVLGVDDLTTMIGHLIADRHDALHPPVEVVTDELVAAAHDAGVLVNTWTVDDPDRIADVARAGVDAVITNDPVTARATLGNPRRLG